jgi:hypothetical protein
MGGEGIKPFTQNTLIGQFGKNQTMSLYDTWIGAGIKGGGTFGFVGMETLEGEVANVGYPTHSHSVNVSSLRLGVGLGGGAGYVAIIIFNCGNLMNLNETRTTDWSVNIALGEKWDGVAKGLKNRKFFTTIAKVGTKLLRAAPEDIDNIRNSISYLYSAYDVLGTSGPKIVTIDIPLAGVGAEISAHYLDGEILIGDLKVGNK